MTKKASYFFELELMITSNSLPSQTLFMICSETFVPNLLPLPLCCLPPERTDTEGTRPSYLFFKLDLVCYITDSLGFY